MTSPVQARRVVARFKGAMEHPSEEARKEYLEEHPNADPAKHKVTEHQEKPSRAKAFLSGLSEKAKAFLSTTSKEAQRFVAEPEHRKETLASAVKSLKAAPKTYAKRVLETAKAEVHEFKEAGEGIGAVLKGGKMTSHQKKAVKTVAIHMGIALTAAALTSTGVLSGAAALGKGMVQKIAMKAAARALENVHLAQEISHIGHGAHALSHIFAAAEEGKKALGPEETLTILVLQSVMKELDSFSDDDMATVLNEASEGGRTAAVLAKLDQLEPAIEVALEGLASIPVAAFGRILIAAQVESESLDGRVWQQRFLPYFEEVFAKIRDLDAPQEVFQDLEGPYPDLMPLLWTARSALEVPRKALPDYAISDIEFLSDPRTGREEITYGVNTLRTWNQELKRWVGSSSRTLKSLLPKVRGLVKTKGLV